MSRKIECPGCGSETSGVAWAIDNGEPCPTCGLSAEAIVTVLEVRRRFGETELTERLAAALKRADAAERKVERLQVALIGVATVLDRLDQGDLR
jgi:hypothetical protein